MGAKVGKAVGFPGVTVGSGVGRSVGDADGLTDGNCEGNALGAALAAMLGIAEGSMLGARLGTSLLSSNKEGERLGRSDDPVGTRLGRVLGVPLETTVGVPLGELLDNTLGAALLVMLGTLEGGVLGMRLGNALRSCSNEGERLGRSEDPVGSVLGSILGLALKIMVGVLLVADGMEDGLSEMPLGWLLVDEGSMDGLSEMMPLGSLLLAADGTLEGSVLGGRLGNSLLSCSKEGERLGLSEDPLGTELGKRLGLPLEVTVGVLLAADGSEEGMSLGSLLLAVDGSLDCPVGGAD